ncbi:ribosome hibernation factor-recruiting GTPase MRF [Nocardia stercoris]|uniref:Cobalamin biosynthesis protein CobW n=1 Tax=Nocardia stercoris TaxID=2483361 RepID=A0A3M2LCQ3_9NOCA|nr:GTP-binding protein [Nocardia stercoris]RMI35319.1 cobalamin biosynthesis protein CobW [Nocardia stercoris]
MDTRTPVVVIAGFADGVRQLGSALFQPGTVLVRHDLTLLNEGAVTRTVTTVGMEQTSLLELAHGCVSCTLRRDLLPLLRILSDRSTVNRIVLLLDPMFEPLDVCAAIENVTVAGVSGRVDAPAGHDVRVTAIVTAVGAPTWLADATGDDVLADRPGVPEDDDRTLAQVTLAHAEHADALVLFGQPDPLDAAVLTAVLARLAPGAPRHWATGTAADTAFLAELPDCSERPRGFDPHASLLRGSPPLDSDADVCLVEFTADRPFHPERLHDAIDTLLDGVVTARGRIWLATQRDQVLWLESAGGGLRIGPAGLWLAAMTPEERQAESPTRRALADLHWHPQFGDRHSSLVVLSYRADPTDIDRALQWALVTDDELRQPNSWHRWPDPFGEWHEDPCAATESTALSPTREGEQPS